jgi:hypothetical protein
MIMMLDKQIFKEGIYVQDGGGGREVKNSWLR